MHNKISSTPFPTPASPFQKRVLGDLEEGRFSIVMVASRVLDRCFAYTVGLGRLSEIGELLISGPSAGVIGEFLYELGCELQSRKISAIEPSNTISFRSIFNSPLHISLERVHRSQKQVFSECAWLYGGLRFKAWQVFLPDTVSFTYPWEDSYVGGAQQVFSRYATMRFPDLQKKMCLLTIRENEPQDTREESSWGFVVNVLRNSSLVGDQVRFRWVNGEGAELVLSSGVKAPLVEGPILLRDLANLYPEIIDALDVPSDWIAIRREVSSLWVFIPG